MFDSEEDMQYEWVDAPDGNTPQVDMILNHRLRMDTSTSAPFGIRPSNTDHVKGKEASELDKQDFDYFVRAPFLLQFRMSD